MFCEWRTERQDFTSIKRVIFISETDQKSGLICKEEIVLPVVRIPDESRGNQQAEQT